MLRMALLGLLVGCTSSTGSAVEPEVDAPLAPDAAPRNDPGPAPAFTPLSMTVTTPDGDLAVEYLYTQASECVGHFGYALEFAQDEARTQPVLRAEIPLGMFTGHEVTGELPVTLRITTAGAAQGATTTNATFTATRIDYAYLGAPRITGRLLATDPSWTVDVAIDALATTSFCPF